MEKYTALLLPAYLSGLAFAVMLIPLLTSVAGNGDGWLYFPLPVSLCLFLMGGALAGIATIYLARGISYLFLDQPQ